MKNAVLFVTYDGLLDPLGSSQILPYLRSIASHPRSLHIISEVGRNKPAPAGVSGIRRGGYWFCRKHR